ncbi:MAG: acetyl/propionyl/methylcrotonyl-CoA carboxylase subunit alpha [Rhodospirillum sp.]|nr:acetyl/propionyl/methylcrotonyl-CoA carboxylase subunit alpha [Rhodospirillum sp.]MCF8489046.1 acetyl/propionyl/methylcrotonyl-CoA carboxylase subunit alpha [Rhodospirillum sp.]MCF8499765.1 acetyl/propionyl/methylcrotonyl-CoA carboxylase subunit alpha [Rhodospirillum sp.]
MFTKILIANRGEIACRVARTARRLGIKTVAVFSDADAGAQHVLACDEAVRIGPAPAAESYLIGAKILEAAKQTGAQAIHPGYGFLSENAAFARACAAEGVVFMGPPPEAIVSMGSKSESKRLMEAAKVPLVPGYHGDDQDDAKLLAEAKRIGFPVLVKASAGGGGKGMRAVRVEGEFDAALAAARREAKNAFGDDTMLIEKYLDNPRHVEIQVFADTQGNVVHLFERDCSVQRRHQKVIEEAPAPGLDPKLRAAMGAAGVAAAKAIGYVGAGTVEFLYQDNAFYFIEMNTRLQVEHPVTEMITGQDLVEWQLRVAAGDPLPLTQAELSSQGHAFEARVYAEDPARDFAPSTGKLVHLGQPAEGPHVRVDTGVAQGDSVSIFYDPMIAKLIVWDRDRASALRRLRSALADYTVAGVSTNLEFLGAVAANPDFAEGGVSTRFIETHEESLFPERQPADGEVLTLAALHLVLTERAEAATLAAGSGDPFSPWSLANGWRLNDDNHHAIDLKDGSETVRVVVHYRRDGFEVDLPGGDRVDVRGELEPDGGLSAEISGLGRRATVVRLGEDLVVLAKGKQHVLGVVSAIGEVDSAVGGGLSAPMPGKVVQVMVAPGDAVTKGQALLVLEAMKMETTIAAPADGVVKEVCFSAGDQVNDGAALIVMEDA